MTQQRYTTTLVTDRRRVFLPVPFDPDKAWARPAAAAFFDSIAQFYRRAYLRYIDATKRRPDERASRIAEVIELLAAGVKERPKA
jgi:uncharacterized protein YdeI (YjbR/CyaY-like superfamily)